VQINGTGMSLTRRALDGWDSAAFLGTFLASNFFLLPKLYGVVAGPTNLLWRRKMVRFDRTLRLLWVYRGKSLTNYPIGSSALAWRLLLNKFI